MKKPLAASKNLMQNYLSELLTEEPLAQQEPSALSPKKEPLAKKKPSATQEPSALSPEKELSAKQQPILNKKPLIAQKIASKADAVNKHKLDKLLQQANAANAAARQTPTKTTEADVNSPANELTNKVKTAVQPIIDKELTDTPLETAKSQAKFEVNTEKNYRNGSFQAMFFDVAGLLIAVPLIELGGIHYIDKINSLMGKPSWYKGVMLYRDEKINVVDTALWVMPEKCNETLLNSLNYQYTIMLGNTSWGMMAENLIDTVTLQQDDVKWLNNNVRRPWLAGLVKDRMCALLDVDELVKMLDDGS
jgi:purine-binding chemotaxis protein CheW